MDKGIIAIISGFMEITPLDTATAEKIAAGEVVERPAQVVKELLENSLDAGADFIEVSVSEGGRRISVVDNGRGISAEDLLMALSPHATSKIKTYEDLWSVKTFGFRGEALASISRMSDLTLMSSRGGLGKSLRSVFGEIQEPHETSMISGTQVHMNSLFENVPARLKFLKTSSAEVTAIKGVVKAIALLSPQVELRLLLGGDLILRFEGTKSAIKRVSEVLGVEKLFETRQESEGLEAQIFYSSPDVVERSPRNIYIFVQGRWVVDRGIQRAILDAYRNLLMHGEYPSVVLNLKVPDGEVDVNVHPMKTQVKFRDFSPVYRLVHNTIRRGLEAAPWIQGVVRDSESRPFAPEKNLKEIQPTQQVPLFDPSGFSSESLHALAGDPKWSELQVVAQVHGTYIITEREDALVFIDQHAAHERVLFERLMRSFNMGGVEVQNFLIPYEMELDEGLVEALIANASVLSSMGLGVERLGPERVGVISAPHLVRDEGLVEAVRILAEDLLEKGESLVLEKVASEVFASMACHSAIRAGQSLSLDEMKSLLSQMDEFSLSSFCPHGRPVFVVRPFRELERDFGR